MKSKCGRLSTSSSILTRATSSSGSLATALAWGFPNAKRKQENLDNLFRGRQFEARPVEGPVMEVAELHLHTVGQEPAVHRAVIRQVHLARVFVFLQPQLETEQLQVGLGE